MNKVTSNSDDDEKNDIDSLYETCLNSIQSLKNNIHQIRSSTNNKNILKSVYSNNKANLNLKRLPMIRQRNELRGHCGKVFTAAWNHSTTEILSCGGDAQLIVWDPLTSNKRTAFRVNSSWFMCSAFSPDDDFITLAGLDNRLCIYKICADDLGLQAMHPSFFLEKHEEFISDFKFISNDRLLSSSGDTKIMLWDVGSRTVLREFTNHTSDITAIDISPLNKENLFISSSQDETLKIWDTREQNACVQQFTFTKSALHLEDGDNSNTNGTTPMLSHIGQDMHEDVASCKYFPDGNAVIAGFEFGSTMLLDIRSLLPLNEYKLDFSNSPFEPSEVCQVNVSKSGSFIYSVYDDDPYVAVWDTLSGEQRQLFDNLFKVGTLAIDDSGYAMALALWNSTVRIFA